MCNSDPKFCGSTGGPNIAGASYVIKGRNSEMCLVSSVDPAN